jgi:DNA-binding XRE family transcriptional regulator
MAMMQTPSLHSFTAVTVKRQMMECKRLLHDSPKNRVFPLHSVRWIGYNIPVGICLNWDECRESSMDAEQFGNALKRLRAQRKLTQKQLAEKSGLSQNAISHWENGEREPGWSAVVQLAKALGVDCRAFLESIEPEQKRPQAKKGK